MNLAVNQWDRERIEQLDTVLASDPYNVDSNCEKGIILLDLCQNEEALACFENSLRRDPVHTKSLVGKGRALMRKEDYDGAEECFNRVPDGDEEYQNAAFWIIINAYYRSRRGRRTTNTAETADEKDMGDSLEDWMERHLGDIQNLEKLLNKFRSAKDENRRKSGHIFHAWLVKKFYEHDSAPKVVAVECSDIEPDTDVDIRLDGDIYIQAWYGKTPLEYTIEGRLTRRTDDPTPLDWCEELKPVLNKLKQLPSKTGKGFVINCVPGISGLVSPVLHNLCSERKCVMVINPERSHINVYGKTCFAYRDKARQIARVLGLPPKFIMGDWNETQSQGRMLEEAHYSVGLPWSLYGEMLHMDKEELLNYAKKLKYPRYEELVNLPLNLLQFRVMQEQRLQDICRQDNINE